MEIRTLSVDPTSKGFGWAVLEGSERLVDWGRTEAQDLAALISKVNELAELYEINLGVLEDARKTYRGKRACQVIRTLRRSLGRRGIEVVTVSRDQVRSMFKDSGSAKWQIAAAIGRWFPELGPLVPPQRKRWMDEDPRMTIFDAVSFGLTALREEEWGLNEPRVSDWL